MSLKAVSASTRAELPGRESELEQLAAHRRAAGDAHGRILVIDGVAGIGKSRLLQHFKSTLVGGRSAVASARCVEHVQTPLRSLRELLAQLERRGSGVRDVAMRSLVERLAFERNAEVTGSTMPSGALFDSIDAAFARYDVRGSLVLLIEDIHWADRSTLAFLSFFADRIERRRILVLATYRSDEVGSTHPSLSDLAELLSRRSVSSLTLRPLDERASRALVEHVLPHPRRLSASTVSDIVRRSQGNPFFAEELVKSVLEGSTEREASKLPLSIRGAVLARSVHPSEVDREIVSLAAVLGERFSIDRLVALLHGDRETVLRALERARALQLVYEEPSAPGELAFRHALTQEVLYQELLAERVRPLHETIALELERQPNREAACIELAHHWRRAGDLERAAAYDEIAGDQAMVVGAPADAVAYYERALSVRVESAELVHKIGVAFGALDQLEAGIERLRRAADLYWRARDFVGFAKNAEALGASLYNWGDVRGATVVYQEAVDALQGELPAATLDLLRARIAYNCVAALDAEAASAFLGQLPDAIEDPLTGAIAHQTRFKVAAMRGEPDRWQREAQAALECARGVGDDGSTLRRVHVQAALDAVALGEVARAREHFRAAAPPKRKGYSSIGALVSAASAFEHTLRGDFDSAATLLREASNAPDQAYAKLIHIKCGNYVLGICSGDDARLSREDSESFLHFGIDHGMKLTVGLLGGPYAWALGLRGEEDEAAVWIARIAKTVPGPHRFMFSYLAAAQFGQREDVLATRQQLREAAARPLDHVNKAVAGLFDAFAAQRGIVETDIREAALAAAAGFDAIGWPWLAARGYELGGDSKRALETYRRLGALRDLRRLEVARPDATESVLTPREREVAQLVATGHSNEEIAQLLHISSRTAEKHVSSALRKLDVRSRVQLGRVLARPQAPLAHED